METFSHIDLDLIRLPRPLPGPLPYPSADLIELASKVGLSALPRIRLVKADDTYQLVTGIHTFRVANALQIFTVEAEVVTFDSETIRALQVMDFNQNATKLTPLQQGRLIQQLCHIQKISLAECGRRLGIHKREASRRVRLLSLPTAILQMIESGKLEEGMARCLLPLEPETQIALAHQAVKEHWTTRKMEAICREKRGGVPTAPPPTKIVTAPPPVAIPTAPTVEYDGWQNINAESEKVGEAIGSPTKIRFNPKTHQVEIVIRCANNDIYEGVRERLLSPASGQSMRFPDEDDNFHI